MIKRLILYLFITVGCMLCGCGSEENDSQSSLTETYEDVNEQEAIQRIEIAQESMDYEPETQQETLVRFTSIAPLFSDDKTDETEVFEDVSEISEHEETEDVTPETEHQPDITETVTEIREQTVAEETEERNPHIRPVG